MLENNHPAVKLASLFDQQGDYQRLASTSRKNDQRVSLIVAQIIPDG
jgi:hypothetical protein